MTKKLMGLVMSVALMGSGVALANEGMKKEDKQAQSQSATGGAGQVGTGQQLGANQLMGRVVKSEKKTLYIEHAGAVVPLKIDKNTQFLGTDLTKAQDFKEGDQIRASFEVQSTENIAKSVERADHGMGGSGMDEMMEDPNALPPAPIDDGTGGSGLEGDMNEEPGSDTGEVLEPDVGADDY